MVIKRRGKLPTKLNIAEMIQLANEYTEEENGKPKYTLRVLCEKWGITKKTLLKYLDIVEQQV